MVAEEAVYMAATHIAMELCNIVILSSQRKLPRQLLIESWQKAAGIIPPHLCETGNTECGGDRYQDTGERGRWLAHFHSLSLSRGRGWPQLRAGAVSWHLSCPSQSPLASLTRAATFQTKGKVEERVMLALWVRQCVGECVRKCPCVRMTLLTEPASV